MKVMPANGNFIVVQLRSIAGTDCLIACASSLLIHTCGIECFDQEPDQSEESARMARVAVQASRIAVARDGGLWQCSLRPDGRPDVGRDSPQP
jgi:hypothetical protein